MASQDRASLSARRTPTDVLPSAPTPRSVLMITPVWQRNGGVATHVMTSAAALLERGVDVHALVARIEPGAPSHGVTLHESRSLFQKDASPEGRLGDAMSANPELVHMHQFEDPDVVRFIQASAPVVISVHGYTACTVGVHYFRPGHACHRPHGPGCVPNLIRCAHTRDPRWLPAAYREATRGVQALQQCDLALCYSTAIEAHLAENQITPRSVIPLFATMTPVQGSGHDARRRVVFAGRIVEPKGPQVLIRAARDVDAEFVLCGEGWRVQAMRRLAERLGVAERVKFRGWLEADELARELAEASIVVLPSVWPEPFGLVGIEAFAAGRPVVASATGGIGDWLQDGVNGISVPPGDPRALARALEQLLSAPARQAEMGAAGKRMAASRFTREHHAEALVDAYRGVLSRRARRTASVSG